MALYDLQGGIHPSAKSIQGEQNHSAVICLDVGHGTPDIGGHSRFHCTLNREDIHPGWWCCGQNGQAGK